MRLIPNIQLVPNWRQLLKHAWSVRLGILAGGLWGLDVVLEALVGAGRGPDWLVYLAGIVSAAAFVSRFVAQPKTLGGGDGGE